MSPSLVVGAILLIAAASPGAAHPVKSRLLIVPQTGATDFSARKKRSPPAVTRPRKPVVVRPWTGPDPSRGPGEQQLRTFQREGRCVIDEGYGRYTFCDNL
jgi:hypothetical protein